MGTEACWVLPSRTSLLMALVLWFLCQVIEATIERHKQNSQTFKAFSGSFGQEEDPSLPPDSPVSPSVLGTREGPGGGVPQAP